MSNETVNALKALRQKAHEALYAREPEYRAIAALDEAIAKIAMPHMVSPQILFGAPTPAPSLIGGAKAPSQADAAVEILRAQARAITTAELVPLVKAKGATVNGKDPRINLASSLSRDARVKSVSVDGVKKWWLEGYALPFDDLLHTGPDEGQKNKSPTGENQPASVFD